MTSTKSAFFAAAINEAKGKRDEFDEEKEKQRRIRAEREDRRMMVEAGYQGTWFEWQREI